MGSPPNLRALVDNALWSGASFQDMAKRHQMMIKKHPHFKLGKGLPYSGIDNLRPETKKTLEASMSRAPLGAVSWLRVLLGGF